MTKVFTVERTKNEEISDAVIRFTPPPKPQPDGGTSLGWTFPCLVVSDYVSDPHGMAETVAEILEENRDRFGITPENGAQHSLLDALYNDAVLEARKAMKRYPQPNYVISKVAEEMGEVVKAAIHCAEERETPENVRAEIVQAIAMLIRLYVEGDRVHGCPSIKAFDEEGQKGGDA